MGMYKYVRDAWRKPTEEMDAVWKARMVGWRQEPTTIRIPKPTRLDRARSLGYKAKQGYILVRQRVNRGGHTRPHIQGGRRSKHASHRMTLGKNYQQIAEERANKFYNNCEVLNSYYVGKDGSYYWYEVILVDVSHPSITSDPRMKWIADAQHKGRVFRGLTSAGHKSRGLRWKGKGVEKMRPSKAARGY